MLPFFGLVAVLAATCLSVHLAIHRQLPRLSRKGNGSLAGGAVLLLIVYGGLFCLGPINSVHRTVETASMQTCRMIALALFQYANDNGTYPDGTSSTAVFQKLLDGNYVSDPAIFYVPMPGKHPAARGSRLQPNNVCYDVTAGLKPGEGSEMPLVFTTGFRIEYRPGGRAISLTKPFPMIIPDGWFAKARPVDGLAVAYQNTSAWFRGGRGQVVLGPDGYGFVHVIPSDAEVTGSYRQLAPNGPL